MARGKTKYEVIQTETGKVLFKATTWDAVLAWAITYQRNYPEYANEIGIIAHVNGANVVIKRYMNAQDIMQAAYDEGIYGETEED